MAATLFDHLQINAFRALGRLGGNGLVDAPLQRRELAQVRRHAIGLGQRRIVVGRHVGRARVRRCGGLCEQDGRT